MAFELNQYLKINWSVELEGGREGWFWKMDLSEKAINLSRGKGTKKPAPWENCRTFCMNTRGALKVRLER